MENKEFNITFWQNYSYKIDYNFLNKKKRADYFLNDIFNEKSYILCFSIDKYDNNHKNIRDGYNLFRMWSQYGDNFKGVCFIIDRRKILNDIYSFYKNDFVIFNKRINYIDYIDMFNSNDSYKNEDVNIKSNDMDVIYNNIFEHIKNNKVRLYFSKDYDYQGENEYRIILINKTLKESVNNQIVTILNSLKGIVLGCNLNKNYEILFKEIIKDKNIELYKQKQGDLLLKKIN